MRDHIKELLVGYVERHEPTYDDYLDAVLRNDLMEAFKAADNVSLGGEMFEVVQYLYQHAPMNSVGSPVKLAEWLLNKPEA